MANSIQRRIDRGYQPKNNSVQTESLFKDRLPSKKKSGKQAHRKRKIPKRSFRPPRGYGYECTTAVHSGFTFISNTAGYLAQQKNLRFPEFPHVNSVNGMPGYLFNKNQIIEYLDEIKSDWTREETFFDHRDTDFSGQDLRYGELSRYDFTGSDFSGARLSRLDLSNSILNDCDFTGTVFEDVDVSGCRISPRFLKNADLTGCVNLDKEIICGHDFRGIEYKDGRFLIESGFEIG